MYRELVPINLDPFIYQNGKLLLDWLGYCLAYVQFAVGSPNAGPDAKTAMGRSTINKNRSMPQGVFVFIWFDHWGTYGGVYKNWGHVALYKDGKIWSSPLTHKPYADTFNSIGAIESNFRATYVGWSTDLSGFRIAEKVANLPVPNPKIEPWQRKVGSVKVAYRRQPKVSGEFIDWLDANAIVDFKGFVRGEHVDGNNVWYVGKYTGGYTWSGAYTNTSINGLVDLTTPPDKPTVPTDPTPPPVEEDKPYVFEGAFDFVDVKPAAQGNFAYKNIPPSPDGIVLHDFGTAGKDTYQSVVNTFQKKGTEVSIHMVFSGDKVTQMVDLQDRAYHAKTGNSLWGFELDPAYKDDPVQIANVRKVIKLLQEREGKKLKLHKHPEFVSTQCGDDIDLALYDVPYPEVTPPEETTPPETTQPEVVEPEESTKTPLTEEMQKAMREDVEKVLAANDNFEPVIGERVKTIAYFATDIGALLATFVLTVLAVVGAIDGNVAIYIAAAVNALMLGMKGTFRLSSKKQ